MKKKFQVFQSTQERRIPWEEVKTLSLEKEADSILELNVAQTYQEWLGFGGALTEAATYNLSKISEANKEKILDAYYDPEQGLGYTHGRVHINSSDFALGNYDYVDEKDETLETFSIDHEEKYVLPILREVNKRTKKPLKLLASPWSPPAWMKTNNEMNNGGKLKKEYYSLWAKYFVKYIEAMQEKGFDIWSVTIQNEPAATQVWDSCIYSAEEEKEFVKYLYEAFQKAELTDIKIVIWDHNRDIMFERADGVLSDPVANQAVWGVGNHWYVSEDFSQLSKVHEKYSDKHLIFTEGCIEGGVQLGSWETGERYARNIIGDMNNWLEAFIDWNIVLDEKGGPNHVGNYCDAPIIVDTKADEVHFNSSFYAIGHFSKWIKSGAKRIEQLTNNEKFQSISFVNIDGSIVSVLLNESEEEQTIELQVGNESTKVFLPAHSLTTIVIQEDK
jgi:glucosylceramidase